MSEDEKLRQVGAATIEYQAALVECGHMEAKIESTFAAYRAAGETMDPRRDKIREPEIIDGKLIVGLAAFKFCTANLLSGEELRELVLERDEARKRLKVAQKAMTRLGMAHVI